MQIRRRIRITSGLLLLFMMLGDSIFLCAQEVLVPAGVQFKLLLKILELDRRFQPANGSDVVVGIVYQRKFRQSLEIQKEMTEIMAKAQEKTESGLRLRAVDIDLLDATDIKAAILQHKIQILYIAPLRSVSLDQITSVSRNVKIRTFTGVPDYADQGIATAIGLKGDKPLIIVNLPAAKAEGSNYSSQLLGLARVIE